MVFNKLSAYKKVIYNALADELGEKVQIDFFIYHGDYRIFERTINEHLEGYQYYVIMPHFNTTDRQSFLKLLKKIKASKLIILDYLIDEIQEFHGAVFQDFKMDIYNAMQKALELFKKYQKLILVFPDKEPYQYPEEIIVGFKNFCVLNQFDFEIINEITVSLPIQKGSAFVVIEENDLVNLIKIVRARELKLTKDVGILSYNDTALKEVLAEGISVITTDFVKMGQLAADMILNQKSVTIKNDVNFIGRKSL